MTLLSTDNVSVSFGGLRALTNVSLNVGAGEIFGVIGPNGAGKSTLFNVIAGTLRRKSGAVTLDGTRIDGLTADAIARRGIGRTFQSATVFRKATVGDNLARAELFARRPFPALQQLFLAQNTPPSDILRANAGLIELSNNLDLAASSLSYGHQKLLGVGMALMSNPKILLMDEPAAGLNSSEKREMAKLITRIRAERGVTILVVEHDMPLVMSVCDRIMVLNRGEEITTGTPAEIQQHAEVINAYLGEPHAVS